MKVAARITLSAFAVLMAGYCVYALPFPMDNFMAFAIGATLAWFGRK